MAKGKKEKVVEMPKAVEPAPEQPAAEQPLANARGSETDAPVEAPTYTLRADRRFDILGLLALRELARADAPERAMEIERGLREFELYEEKYLR